MRVRFLGTAAGGGLPQWNCACEGCTRARREGTARTQDCLAVSGDGSAWYLLNTSPDLRTQLLNAPELTPSQGLRVSPIRGVLFTSAELDHTLGLFTLREADQLAVYGTRPVLAAIPAAQVIGNYSTVDWRTISCGVPFELDGGLTATAFLCSAKRPRYAQEGESQDWVIGYRVVGAADDRVLVYAPCLALWPPRFAAIIADADLVVLDGTFFHSDEMARRTGLDRPASSMGHLPIEATLPLIRDISGPRYTYTHLNNTNPLAHPDAPEHELLTAVGADVAPEAGLIQL
ncbi:pyrroloquinoline quinone biosynthesis protein PqqB [Nakamurella lactea]|uniref:pyrroloquinoline quinone biosynthesis protein PqqB n=1 Tax=Nakamurella lactea TaxID=459515 RepID=UPI000415E85F|nr:MBL fold metallo-hydrolase [Nakamurella lactea]